MSAFTTFGPGTVVIGDDYSGEVLSFTVNHAYTEAGSKRTMLNGDIRRAKKVRDTDSVTMGIEPDLTANGLYYYIQTNDLTEETLTYTPSTEDGAAWSGLVELALPESVDGSEFGAALTASITLSAVTTLVFTPDASS